MTSIASEELKSFDAALGGTLTDIVALHDFAGKTVSAKGGLHGSMRHSLQAAAPLVPAHTDLTTALRLLPPPILLLRLAGPVVSCRAAARRCGAAAARGPGM